MEFSRQDHPSGSYSHWETGTTLHSLIPPHPLRRTWRTSTPCSRQRRWPSPLSASGLPGEGCWKTCQASPQEFLTQEVGVGKRIYISQKCTGRVLIQLVQGRHFENHCCRAFWGQSTWAPDLLCVSRQISELLWTFFFPPQRDKPDFSLNIKQNKTKINFFFSYRSSICSWKNQTSKQKIKINGSEEERWEVKSLLHLHSSEQWSSTRDSFASQGTVASGKHWLSQLGQRAEGPELL